MISIQQRGAIKRARNFNLLALLLASLSLFFSSISWAQDNPIVIENTLLGSNQWQITNPANDLDSQIKGFASLTSVNKGNQIDFFVTTEATQDFTIEIYRMGWYNGTRGRLMRTIALPGILQPEPEIKMPEGMVTCSWASNYSLTIPLNWTSGIYLAKLINTSGFENYIVFTVRDDSRTADFLYQQPVTTYQAYNAFPAEGIGKSLYEYQSSDVVTTIDTVGNELIRASRVSFDRPYSGDGSGGFFDYDIYMIGWLERNGYDVTYSTNIDVHQKGANYLQQYKAFLSVGHDEYWSKEMYDAAETARDAGIHLAFLGANDVYWQIRMTESDSGAADRVIISYKDYRLDTFFTDPVTGEPIIDPATGEPVPVPPALKTDLWRSPDAANRPEQTLVGVQYLTYNFFMEDGSTNSDFTPDYANIDHWVYEGTGLGIGDFVPGIVGYEVDVLYPEVPFEDSDFPTYPHPESLSYTRLGDSYFLSIFGDEWSESSIYQAPSEAWVFAAGTMSWSWGLDKLGFSHSGIQKMTENIFNRFVPPAPDPIPGNESCNTYMNTDGSIPWTKKSIRSKLRVPDQGKITDVNIVQLSGTQTKYFKDLKFFVKSPSGKSVEVLKKCRSKVSAFNLNLDDQAAQVISKSDCAPNDGATYKSQKKAKLKAFNKQKSQGTWQLFGKADKPKKGSSGSLNSWGLEICTVPLKTKTSIRRSDDDDDDDDDDD